MSFTYELEKDNITYWRKHDGRKTLVTCLYQDILKGRFEPYCFEGSWIERVCDMSDAGVFNSTFRVLNDVLTALGRVPEIVELPSFSGTFRHLMDLSPAEKQNCQKTLVTILTALKKHGPNPETGFKECIVEGSRKWFNEVNTTGRNRRRRTNRAVDDDDDQDVDVYSVNSVGTLLDFPCAREAYECVQNLGEYQYRDALFSLLNEVFLVEYENGMYRELILGMLEAEPDMLGIRGSLIYMKAGARPPIGLGTGPEHATLVNLNSEFHSQNRYSRRRDYLRINDRSWDYIEVNKLHVIVTETYAMIVDSKPIMKAEPDPRLDIMKSLAKFAIQHTKLKDGYHTHKYQYNQSIQKYVTMLKSYIDLVKARKLQDPMFTKLFSSTNPADVAWSEIVNAVIAQYRP